MATTNDEVAKHPDDVALEQMDSKVARKGDGAKAAAEMYGDKYEPQPGDGERLPSTPLRDVMSGQQNLEGALLSMVRSNLAGRGEESIEQIKHRLQRDEELVALCITEKDLVKAAGGVLIAGALAIRKLAAGKSVTFLKHPTEGVTRAIVDMPGGKQAIQYTVKLIPMWPGMDRIIVAEGRCNVMEKPTYSSEHIALSMAETRAQVRAMKQVMAINLTTMDEVDEDRAA